MSGSCSHGPTYIAHTHTFTSYLIIYYCLLSAINFKNISINVAKTICLSLHVVKWLQPTFTTFHMFLPYIFLLTIIDVDGAERNMSDTE